MMLDATEKLIVLLHQEKTLYEATDYLVARSGKRQKHNQKPTDQQLNRMKWRKTCCIWAYQGMLIKCNQPRRIIDSLIPYKIVDCSFRVL
jgi:hypothetical protein